jgi:hypothetical protein
MPEPSEPQVEENNEETKHYHDGCFKKRKYVGKAENIRPQ